MKFNIREFKTSKEKKTAGVWVDFGSGARIKIASFENPEFMQEFRRQTEPYNRMQRDVPPDEQTAILNDCASKYIILDWEGIYDGDEEIRWSKENAKNLLTEVDWFRDRVVEESRKFANFREEETKEIEKNSPTT